MKKVLRGFLAIILCFALATPAFALDGIWHDPYGIDDLYETQPTERYPRDPQAGEMVYVKSTTCVSIPPQTASFSHSSCPSHYHLRAYFWRLSPPLSVQQVFTVTPIFALNAL